MPVQNFSIECCKGLNGFITLIDPSRDAGRNMLTSLIPVAQCAFCHPFTLIVHAMSRGLHSYGVMYARLVFTMHFKPINQNQRRGAAG